MKGCELLHGKMSDHADVLTQICGISSSLQTLAPPSPISVFFLVGSFILVIVFSCHRSLQIFAVVFYHFYKPLKFCHHYYDQKIFYFCQRPFCCRWRKTLPCVGQLWNKSSISMSLVEAT